MLMQEERVLSEADAHQVASSEGAHTRSGSCHSKHSCQTYCQNCSLPRIQHRSDGLCVHSGLLIAHKQSVICINLQANSSEGETDGLRWFTVLSGCRKICLLCP